MFSQDVCFATEICSVPLLPSTRVKKGKALEFEKSHCVSGLFEEVLGLRPSCHPVKKSIPVSPISETKDLNWKSLS